MSSLRALIGRPVIASDTAEQLGSADGVVIDPTSRLIVAVHLATKHGGFVSWDDVRSIGSDAVMVSSSTAARDASGPWEERAARGAGEVLGKRLLDDGGDELGVVDDVVFDDSDGAVQQLTSGETAVASDRLLGVGSYAVVVRAEH